MASLYLLFRALSLIFVMFIETETFLFARVTLTFFPYLLSRLVLAVSSVLLVLY